MTRQLLDELGNVVFLLRSHNFLKAHIYVHRAIDLLKKTPEQPIDNALREDYSKTVSSLRETVSMLRKCATSSKPGDTNSCKDIARDVYRQTLILYLLGTGEIRRVVRARRLSYLALSLGLPTSALFGLSPVAVGLIFMGALWTYPYFVRLKLIGWTVLVSGLVLLLPFLFNALGYFTYAISSSEEISNIASTLGLEIIHAALLVTVLLVVSAVSLALDLYSLSLLFKYKSIFK